MAKVKNLLYQPLELDFVDMVVRLNAREIKEIDDKYLTHPAFKRNEKYLQVAKKKDVLDQYKETVQTQQEKQQPKRKVKSK